MEPKPKASEYTVRYSIKPNQIMDFVAGLHNMQADMIEELVEREQAQDFPQVQQILERF